VVCHGMSQQLLLDAAKLLSAEGSAREVLIVQMLRELVSLLRPVPPPAQTIAPSAIAATHCWTGRLPTSCCTRCGVIFRHRRGVSCQAEKYTPSTTAPPSNTGIATMLDLE
jgi:hypothetical protein